MAIDAEEAFEDVAHRGLKGGGEGAAVALGEDGGVVQLAPAGRVGLEEARSGGGGGQCRGQKTKAGGQVGRDASDADAGGAAGRGRMQPASASWHQHVFHASHLVLHPVEQ